MYFDTRNFDDEVDRLPPLTPPALPVESFVASFAPFHFRKQSDSYDRAIRAPLEAGLKRLREVSGEQPDTLERLVPETRRPLSPDQLRAVYRENDSLIRGLNDPLIPPYDEVIEGAKIRALELEQEEGRVSARSHGLAAVAGWAGTMSAAMTDPVNVLSLPLGASVGAGLLARMGAQALVNATTEAGIQLTNEMRSELGMERPAGEMVADVAAAAAGGALFEGGATVLARAYRAARQGGRVKMSPRLEAAAEVIEDLERIQKANPTPDVPGTARAHLEKMEAATAAVIHAEPPPPEPPRAAPVPTGEAALDYIARRRKELADDYGAAVAAAERSKPRTIAAEVRALGGIREEWLRSNYNWRETVIEGKLRPIVARKAAALEGEEMAEALAEKGVIPPGTTGDELVEMLKERRVAELIDRKTARARLEAFVETQNYEGQYLDELADALQRSGRTDLTVAQAETLMGRSEPEPDLGDAIRAKDEPAAPADAEMAAATKPKPEVTEGKSPKGEGDSPEPEVDPEVEAALAEHGEVLVGTGEVDAEGKPFMKTLREVLSDNDEDRVALDAIRNCIIGGGNA